MEPESAITAALDDYAVNASAVSKKISMVQQGHTVGAFCIVVAMLLRLHDSADAAAA